jgi:hypothetical protein
MASECIYERKLWPSESVDVYQPDSRTQLGLIGRVSKLVKPFRSNRPGPLLSLRARSVP